MGDIIVMISLLLISGGLILSSFDNSEDGFGLRSKIGCGGVMVGTTTILFLIARWATSF